MEFNPFAPAVQQNPYPYFAHLRNHSPVYWVEPLQSWAVSRYADVAYIAKNTQLFSSAPIIPAILGDQNPVPEVNWLISADPPVHTHLRKLVSKAFTPRMVGALEPRIKEIVAQLLDHIEEQGAEFDLVRDFSTPLPLMVIAEMLGVEPERYREFKQWSDDMIRATGGAEVSPAERDRLRGSMDDLRRYFEQAIEDRRGSSGGEDLISALVRAEEEREALTAREVLAMCLLLLLGGNETTTNLIGNTVMTLLSHPAELAKVRGDLASVPQMIEEMLRYEAPAQALLRVATADTEVAGKAIRAGSGIMILYGSANRDERQFPNPDTFDVMRNPRDHLAFGFGIHHCIGAPLARLEARIAMDAFLRRFPRVRLSDQPREWIDSFVMRGPKSLLLQLS
jgi:cytochrome P450